jgi:hypothetical protein
MAGPPSPTEPPLAIPATPTAPGQAGPTSTDLVLKVLGAVGAGIGVLGFVTFFGGAIVWLRAEKARLPATEAVAVIPRNVLVISGATFLLPAVLIAIGVVAVVFLIDLGFYLGRQKTLGPIREQANTFRREAAQLSRSAVVARQAWKDADASLKGRSQDLERARQRNAPDQEIIGLEATVEKQLVVEARAREAAETVGSSATMAQANAEDRVEESEVELKRSARQWWIELTAAGVALMLMVPICNGAIFDFETALEPLVLTLVAVSGTALTLSVYRASEKFIWFGIIAFVAVGGYLSAATYISTHRNAKMQPVAALWSGHAPVTGAFVAETSQNLYVGSFREKKTPPRLVVIPRSQVTEVEIGPLLDMNVARRRAIGMALNECRQQIEEPATARRGPRFTEACTETQETALSDQIGTPKLSSTSRGNGH